MKNSEAGCQVNFLRIIGNDQNFEVYIVPHKSSAFSEIIEQERKKLGIIGVSCVSSLISGGWKSDSLGIPTQCVLLENCECTNHWTKKATDRY